MSNPYQSPSAGQSNLDAFELTEKCLQKVRISQIITVALITGAVLFLLFALWSKKATLDGAMGMLNGVGMLFALMAFGGSMLIPDVVAKASLEQLDPEEFATLNNEDRFLRLAPIFETRNIVSCALIEGAAYLNILAYFLEPFVGSLVVVAALLALLFTRYPTANTFQNWIANTARDLGQTFKRE